MIQRSQKYSGIKQKTTPEEEQLVSSYEKRPEQKKGIDGDRRVWQRGMTEYLINRKAIYGPKQYLMKIVKGGINSIIELSLSNINVIRAKVRGGISDKKQSSEEINRIKDQPQQKNPESQPKQLGVILFKNDALSVLNRIIWNEELLQMDKLIYFKASLYFIWKLNLLELSKEGLLLFNFILCQNGLYILILDSERLDQGGSQIENELNSKKKKIIALQRGQQLIDCDQERKKEESQDCIKGYCKRRRFKEMAIDV